MQRQELRARQAAGSMACVSFCRLTIFLVCLKPTLCRKSSGQKFFGSGTYFAADTLTYEGLQPTGNVHEPERESRRPEPATRSAEPAAWAGRAAVVSSRSRVSKTSSRDKAASRIKAVR